MGDDGRTVKLSAFSWYLQTLQPHSRINISVFHCWLPFLCRTNKSSSSNFFYSLLRERLQGVRKFRGNSAHSHELCWWVEYRVVPCAFRRWARDLFSDSASWVFRICNRRPEIQLCAEGLLLWPKQQLVFWDVFRGPVRNVLGEQMEV